MRVTLLWISLAVSGGVFVAMMIAIHHNRRHGTVPAHLSALIEYGWALVPWLILAVCAAPAVHRVLAAVAD